MVAVDKSEYAFHEEQFQEFCRQYSLRFPQEFVEYLRAYNNGELAPNVVSSSDDECYVRYFYGIGDEDYSDIRSTYECYAGRLPAGCVAIADADFGNVICMSLNEDSYGKIYFWDHETMDTDEGESGLSVEDMECLADSFSGLLDVIVASPYADVAEEDGFVVEKPSFWHKVLEFFDLR